MTQRCGKVAHSILHDDLLRNCSSRGRNLCNLMQKHEGCWVTSAKQALGHRDKAACICTCTAVLSRFHESSAVAPVFHAAGTTAKDEITCFTDTSTTTGHGQPGRHWRRSRRWGLRWGHGRSCAALRRWRLRTVLWQGGLGGLWVGGEATAGGAVASTAPYAATA